MFYTHVKIEALVHFVGHQSPEWTPSYDLECYATVDEFLYEYMLSVEQRLETLTQAVRSSGVIVPDRLNLHSPLRQEQLTPPHQPAIVPTHQSPDSSNISVVSLNLSPNVSSYSYASPHASEPASSVSAGTIVIVSII